MERRDYIMQMIEELGRMLIALRRRILGGSAEREEVRGELSEAAKLGGLDYDLARAMGPDTLRTMVAPGGDVDPGRCWLLAELSYLDGLEADLAGDPEEAREAFERAGFLYGLLRPLPGNVVGVAEADDRLEEIELRLEGLGPRRGRLRSAAPASPPLDPATAR